MDQLPELSQSAEGRHCADRPGNGLRAAHHRTAIQPGPAHRCLGACAEFGHEEMARFLGRQLYAQNTPHPFGR